MIQGSPLGPSVLIQPPSIYSFGCYHMHRFIYLFIHSKNNKIKLKKKKKKIITEYPLPGNVLGVEDGPLNMLLYSTSTLMLSSCLHANGGR